MGPDEGKTLKLRTTRVFTGSMLTAAALTAALLSGGTAQADPAYPAPDPDPFYSQAAAEGTAGTPISVRRAPDLMTFPGVAIWQVSYRSTNSENKPIAAVSTILVPPNQAQDGPLLSYQHIVNALGTGCAPSRALYASDPNIVIREAPILNVALQTWMDHCPSRPSRTQQCVRRRAPGRTDNARRYPRRSESSRIA